MMPSESSKLRKSRNLKLGNVLQAWTDDHNGRLWQTAEEISVITEQTDFTKLQINNWFAPRRKDARLILERSLLENPQEFMSGYNDHAAKTLEHFFATLIEFGYLPEAGKTMIAESTGLSTRSIVDLFDKLRENPRFNYAAAVITNMQTPDSIMQRGAARPVDTPIPLSPACPVTALGPSVPVRISRPPAPRPIQIEQAANKFALYELFRSYGVLADDDDTETICSREDCSYPRLYRSLYCPIDLVSQTVSSQTRVCKAEHQNFVSQQLQVINWWLEIGPIIKFWAFPEQTPAARRTKTFCPRPRRIYLKETACGGPVCCRRHRFDAW